MADRAPFALLALLATAASAADTPPAEISAQACIELQIRGEAFGFAIGDRVQAGDLAGVLSAFSCAAHRPAAWIVEPRTGRAVAKVPLAQLQRLAP